jgi:cytochrome c oxidase subunit II
MIPMTEYTNLVSRVLKAGGSNASPVAARVDFAFRVALYLSGALFLAFVLVLLLVWLTPSRSSSTSTRPQNGRATPWLFIWGLGAFGIASVYFWLGLGPFVDGAVAPSNAVEIRATSRAGNWLFEYPNGKKSFGELAVPRWQPVRLHLSSADLPHEFYLPRFRVRETAILGRYTSVWFQPTDALSTRVECTTFCPELASSRSATVKVLEPSRFDDWLSAKSKTPKKANTEGQ